jgi:hypothetical protein
MMGYSIQHSGDAKSQLQPAPNVIIELVEPLSPTPADRHQLDRLTMSIADCAALS